MVKCSSVVFTKSKAPRTSVNCWPLDTMNRILNLYKRSRNEAKKHPCLPRKILPEAGKHLLARYAAMGRDESLRCEAIPSCPRESILTHNGCQVRLLQRINTQIPNRLVCLHRCQQCYAHQVPSIPDAFEINLIPDLSCEDIRNMLPHLQLLLWAGQPNRWHLLLQYLTDLHRLHFG